MAATILTDPGALEGETPEEKRRRLLRGATERIVLAARLLDSRVSDANWQGDPALTLVHMKAVERALGLASLEAERTQP